MAESMSGNKPLRVVFVGNIPYDTTEEQLLDIFRTVGPVLSFRLVFDRDTGKAKGYGFCEYSDPETARSAIRNLNNYEMNGRQLRVDFADSELGTPKDFKISLKEPFPPSSKGKRKDDKDFDREKELIPGHKDYDYLFQDPSNPHGNYRMPPPVQESYYPPPPHHHHHPMHQYPPPPHGPGPSPYGYPHPPPPQGAPTGHPAYPPPPSGHYEYGPGGHPPPPPHHYRGGPPPDIPPNYPGPHGPAPPPSQAPYGYYPPIPPSGGPSLSAGGPPPPLGPSQPSPPGPSKMPTLSQHPTTQTAPSSAESIANALSSLPPEQILSILSQMKNLVQSNVQIAKNLLTSNPQLTFALFHALWKLDLIDSSTIQRIISHSTGGNLKEEPSMKEESVKESASTGITAGSGKTKTMKSASSELKEQKKESKRTISSHRGDHPPPPPPSFPPSGPSTVSSSSSSTIPSSSPSSTFMPSSSAPSPSTNQPAASSISGGSASVGNSGGGQTVADQQKALILRIMQLTQSQIDALPADQREKVLLIKSQIQSQQQSKKS